MCVIYCGIMSPPKNMCDIRGKLYKKKAASSKLLSSYNPSRLTHFGEIF